MVDIGCIKPVYETEECVLSVYLQTDSPLFGGRPASASGSLTGFSSSSPTPGQQSTLLTSAFTPSLVPPSSSAAALNVVSNVSSSAKITTTAVSIGLLCKF